MWLPCPVDTSKGALRTLTEDDKHSLLNVRRNLVVKGTLTNFFVDDRSSLTLMKIRSRTRRAMMQAKRRNQPMMAVFIDYAQLVGADETDDARRHEQMTALAKGLKILATENNLIVVCLAQLNDDSRAFNRLPRGEDIRECKDMRSHCDKMILLHNASGMARRAKIRSSEELSREVRSEVVDCIIDKNRGAKEGRVCIVFNPSLSSFSDITDEDRERHLAAEQTANEAAANARHKGKR